MVFRNNILFYIHCEKQHLFSTAGFFVPQSWVSVWNSFLVAQAISLIIYCRMLSQSCFVLSCFSGQCSGPGHLQLGLYTKSTVCSASVPASLSCSPSAGVVCTLTTGVRRLCLCNCSNSKIFYFRCCVSLQCTRISS